MYVMRCRYGLECVSNYLVLLPIDRRRAERREEMRRDETSLAERTDRRPWKQTSTRAWNPRNWSEGGGKNE